MSSAAATSARHRADRRGDEGDLGLGVEADGVDRAELDRRWATAGVDVHAAHEPAPGAQRQADRTADEACADDLRGAALRSSASVRVSRAGRHGAAAPSR